MFLANFSNVPSFLRVLLVSLNSLLQVTSFLSLSLQRIPFSLSFLDLGTRVSSRGTCASYHVHFFLLPFPFCSRVPVTVASRLVAVARRVTAFAFACRRVVFSSRSSYSL